MVEDVEGCNVGVKCLGIAKVANPRVIYNSLDEDFDTALSSLVNLVVLNQGGPGSFGTNTIDARSFWDDRQVVIGQAGGWAYEGSAVVMEIAIRAGNKAPQVVDAIDAVIGGLCWNPRGLLLQEIPITKHWQYPLSGQLPQAIQLMSTWPVKNTTETYHSLQPSKNRNTIEAHNSRVPLLAVSLIEVS